MTYAERYYTDPSICDEELTPEVLEEIGRHKHNIIEAVLPHWPNDGEYLVIEALALELKLMTPDFVRALAKALQKE
jgi:hypothetical protein